jgi:uncharacterized protein DUF6299
MYARTATGIACLAVLFGADTAASAPGYDISAHNKAVIAADHTVTASGTYRCTGSVAQKPIVVTASVQQGGVSISGGSQEAVCDGKLHNWFLKSQGFRGSHLNSGPATVKANLAQIKPRSGLIPIEMNFLASTEQQVELVPQD